MTTETLVREYRSRNAFEKDAQILAKQNYKVVSVADQQQQVGCLRVLLIGIFAIFFKPKPKLIVTYEKAS